MPQLPRRKRIVHEVPEGIDESSLFFVTICARQRNVNVLAKPKVADGLLLAADETHHRGHWWLVSFVVMPDHVHLIAGFSDPTLMQRVVTSWKRFTARQLGIKWQRDFFDHRMRSGESVLDKAEYIRQNPVRAGLVQKVDDWPYWTAPGCDGVIL